MIETLAEVLQRDGSAEDCYRSLGYSLKPIPERLLANAKTASLLWFGWPENNDERSEYEFDRLYNKKAVLLRLSLSYITEFYLRKARGYDTKISTTTGKESHNLPENRQISELLWFRTILFIIGYSSKEIGYLSPDPRTKKDISENHITKERQWIRNKLSFISDTRMAFSIKENIDRTAEYLNNHVINRKALYENVRHGPFNLPNEKAITAFLEEATFLTTFSVPQEKIYHKLTEENLMFVLK